MNRGGGPEGVIDAVEQRAPDGFTNIDDVLSYEERKAIVRGYASTAGFRAAAGQQDRQSGFDQSDLSEIAIPERIAEAQLRIVVLLLRGELFGFRICGFELLRRRVQPVGQIIATAEIDTAWISRSVISRAASSAFGVTACENDITAATRGAARRPYADRIGREIPQRDVQQILRLRNVLGTGHLEVENALRGRKYSCRMSTRRGLVSASTDTG